MSDTAYLQELFFNQVDLVYPGVHMKLWRHMNETRDTTVLGIMDKIDKHVQDQFGDDFVIWHDFYSYLDSDTSMFPLIHQDNEFWATENHDCAGFNLWFLLNHSSHNQSFDIYEMDQNPGLYKGVDFNEPTFKERELWVPRFYDDTKNATPTQIPLSIGEALVVKQPEIHQTDPKEVPEGQWRLAIGFKVVKRGTIVNIGETPLRSDPNYVLIREDPWLPDYEVGSQLVSPFNVTLMHEYWQHLDVAQLSTAGQPAAQ